MKTKPISWPVFIITLLINFVVITLLAWIGNQVFTSPEELLCRKQMKILQVAVNQYNQAHPEDKKGSMEFGFPGFVEKTLIPQQYVKETIADLREKHSYFLQRNGFVNCREHPRNPFALYLMGLVILSVIGSVLELGFMGYQIHWKDTPSSGSTNTSA
jgi:hypothetical protein